MKKMFFYVFITFAAVLILMYSILYAPPSQRPEKQAAAPVEQLKPEKTTAETETEAAEPQKPAGENKPVPEEIFNPPPAEKPEQKKKAPLWENSTAHAGTETLPADPLTLLEKMDDVMRSSSHDMTVTMDVKTSRWERHYKLRVWMKGVDYAFARVLEPSKVEGQGFLRVESRLWNYLPTAERTILIPPSMMLDRFMGSDFSNDDFVKLSYLPRDYEGKVSGEEVIDGTDSYFLVLMPYPDAPVTYGKLHLWVRKTDAAPVRIQFFNEKLKHIRTLHYSGFKSFNDHEIPTHWRMQNVSDPDRKTVVIIEDARFDVALSDEIFTRGNLEKYP